MDAKLDIDVDPVRLAETCERYGIGALWIFGSFARGTAGPDSDVDLLYVLRPGRRLGWDIEQLSDELAELFGRPVDLVSRKALPELLRPTVLADAQEFYRCDQLILAEMIDAAGQVNRLAEETSVEDVSVAMHCCGTSPYWGRPRPRSRTN